MSRQGRLIAVTGAAGLLGRAVVAEMLAAGFAVRGIDRVPLPTAPTPASDHVIAELTDYAEVLGSLVGCAGVVHLAALPSPVSDTPSEVWRINTTIAGNVLFAASQSGVGDLVIASSQSALGLPYAGRVTTPLYLPVDEDHPRWPSDAYSVSKAASEDLAAALCREGGLNVCCLRFPVIWNPERHAEHVVRRMGAPQQGPKSLWAYVDLRDAARAVRLAVEARLSGFRVLNITSRRAFADRPVPELVRKWFPSLRDIRAPLTPDSALFDWRRARQIGFRAHFVWSKDRIAEEAGWGDEEQG